MRAGRDLKHAQRRAHAPALAVDQHLAPRRHRQLEPGRLRCCGAFLELLLEAGDEFFRYWLRLRRGRVAGRRWRYGRRGGLRGRRGGLRGRVDRSRAAWPFHHGTGGDTAGDNEEKGDRRRNQRRAAQTERPDTQQPALRAGASAGLPVRIGEAPRCRRAADHRVHVVAANMLVGARTLVVEQRHVVARQARHHLEERTRNQQLAWLREAHYPLRYVDTVADDVHLAVEVLHQTHRPEIDAHSYRERCRQVAHRDRGKQRVLRIAKEGDRGAVAGVEDDAVALPHLLERGSERLVERLLELQLLGNRLLRILGDVEKQHTADQRAA